MNRAFPFAAFWVISIATPAQADPLCDGLVHVAGAIPVDFKTLIVDGNLPAPTLMADVRYNLPGAVLHRFDDGTSSPPCEVGQMLAFDGDGGAQASGHYVYSCTLASAASAASSTDAMASRVAVCLATPLPAPVPTSVDNEHGLRIYEIESRGVKYTVSEDRPDLALTLVPYVEIRIETITH